MGALPAILGLRFRLIVRLCGLWWQSSVLVRSIGRLLIEPGCLQQSFARGIFAVINQRAVPGELPRTPGNHRQQQAGNHDGIQKSQTEQSCRGGQDAAEQSGVFRALFDADPGHEDGAEDEPEQHPLHPLAVFAGVAGLQQKERQAPHEEHDQRGADGDDHVIGERFFASGLRHVVTSPTVRRKDWKSPLRCRCCGCSPLRPSTARPLRWYDRRSAV